MSEPIWWTTHRMALIKRIAELEGEVEALDGDLKELESALEIVSEIARKALSRIAEMALEAGERWTQEEIDAAKAEAGRIARKLHFERIAGVRRQANEWYGPV